MNHKTPHRWICAIALLVSLSIFASSQAQASSKASNTQEVQKASRRTTTTTTIPFRKLPIPRPPQIDPDRSLMSYRETGKFSITINNDVNPRLSDSPRYLNFEIYRYVANSRDVVSVCGGDKWQRIRDRFRNVATPKPSGIVRTSSNSYKFVLDLSPWFKPGDKFLIKMMQYEVGDPLRRTKDSDWSSPSCYENTVRPGVDIEYRNCMSNGSIMSFAKFTFAAASATKILRLPEFLSLKRADPNRATELAGQLERASKSKSKKVVMSLAKTARGSYQVKVAESDGETALALLSLVSVLVLPSNPLIALVFATAGLVFNLRDTQANCELIYNG
jgi:hypothetical protein